MKKLFLCLLAVSLAAAPLVRADDDRDTLAAHIRNCEAVLRDFMGDPATAIPPAVLATAHALVIVHQVKASFILGFQGGYAVALVKKHDGHWSVPGFLHAGEVSLGLQAGGKSTDLVLVLTDDATAHNLLQTRFNVGVDAKAVAGPHAQEAETSSDILKTPVLIYSKSIGLYAGATVKSGYLTRDDASNQLFYNTRYGLPEILYSDWVQPVPEVLPLMNYVQQIAP
ncbi:MAG TPA: lipid-binding SYLF domain-containing protein [Opitutaceae bacterium]|jgi:lipid-binding SYLF domain-containing protein|nr:lipid-binding SYLF domain-containing protein [Opitutaceae bacterium]